MAPRLIAERSFCRYSEPSQFGEMSGEVSLSNLNATIRLLLLRWSAVPATSRFLCTCYGLCSIWQLTSRSPGRPFIFLENPTLSPTLCLATMLKGRSLCGCSSGRSPRWFLRSFPTLSCRRQSTGTLTLGDRGSSLLFLGLSSLHYTGLSVWSVSLPQLLQSSFSFPFTWHRTFPLSLSSFLANQQIRHRLSNAICQQSVICTFNPVLETPLPHHSANFRTSSAAFNVWKALPHGLLVSLIPQWNSEPSRRCGQSADLAST